MNKKQLADRYQNRPWYVKLYRLVRYKPYGFTFGLYAYLMTDEDFNVSMKLGMGMADIKMNRSYTAKETFNRLFKEGI